jgi:YggT family protein
MLLYQIVSFLLDVAVGLLGGACLLRLYMQHQRVPFGNPVGRLVFALSNWVVLPLRRILPPMGRWDTASLVAVYLLELAQYGVLWLLLGGATVLTTLPLMAVFGVVRLAISGLTGLLIVYAILSWFQGNSPLYGVIDRLCAPFLKPVRRIIPMVGGVDLSPLALLVLLQVLAIVLANLQQQLLR